MLSQMSTQIFEAIFQPYFITSATSVKVVLSQSGWMIFVVVVDRILAEQCHKPGTHPLATDMSAKLLFLFVCK